MRAALLYAGPCLVLTIVLAPALKTGWFGDDAFNSNLPAVLKVEHLTLLGVILRTSAEWLKSNGRFYPLSIAERSCVFALFANLQAYKIFLLATTLVAELAFIRFLRAYADDWSAGVAGLIFACIVQIRGYHDVSLAYNGLVQLVAAGLFCSLSLHLGRIKGASRASGAIAVVLFAVMCAAYELAYVLPPLYTVSSRAFASTREAIVRTIPYYAIAAAFAIGSIVLRSHAVAPGSLYSTNLSIARVLAAYVDQFTAALPLSYALLDPHAIFERIWFLESFIDFPIPLVLLLASSPIVVALLKREDRAATGRRLMLLFGALLMALPPLPLAIVEKYQDELHPGLGYLPVFLQIFGVAVCSTVAVERLSRVWRSGAFFNVVAATTLTIAFWTAAGNAHLAEIIEEPYLTSRESFDRSVAAGLLQKLPPGAAIAFDRPWPWVCLDDACPDGMLFSDRVSLLAGRRIRIGVPASASLLLRYDAKHARWQSTNLNQS